MKKEGVLDFRRQAALESDLMGLVKSIGHWSTTLICHLILCFHNVQTTTLPPYNQRALSLLMYCACIPDEVHVCFGLLNIFIVLIPMATTMINSEVDDDDDDDDDDEDDDDDQKDDDDDEDEGVERLSV